MLYRSIIFIKLISRLAGLNLQFAMEYSALRTPHSEMEYSVILYCLWVMCRLTPDFESFLIVVFLSAGVTHI